MISRQKICKMPGCGVVTDRQFCHPCWKKIPPRLRVAFAHEPDRVKKREAFIKILDWVEGKAPESEYPVPGGTADGGPAVGVHARPVMTAAEHNAFPNGRWSR